jgi:hypothetical protein
MTTGSVSMMQATAIGSSAVKVSLVMICLASSTLATLIRLASPGRRTAARVCTAPGPVRRHQRLQQARGGALRSTRPQAAGEALTLHHPARAVG